VKKIKHKMAKASKNNTIKLKFDSARKLAPAPESKSGAKIDPQYDLFINGKFEKPASKKYFASINPATEESLQTLLKGQGVLKGTTTLTSSGTVKTPTSGKKLRVYATRFSLSADMTSVSFRFTSGGTDYELYVSPKTGGLYGANNHPNYVEGGINEVLYCAISGTGTVQINFDYLEV
jgi:hypothetical protein